MEKGYSSKFRKRLLALKAWPTSLCSFFSKRETSFESVTDEIIESQSPNPRPRKIKTLFLNHILPITLFLSLSFFIFRKLIGAEGEIVHYDLVRPPELDRFFEFYFPMWNEHQGISVLSTLPQLLFYLPFFGIGFLFDLDTLSVLVLILIVSQTLAGVSMYYMSRYLLSRSFEASHYIVFSSSLFTGFAYSCSNFFISHGIHPFIRLTYALAPFLILSIIVGIEKRKRRFFVLAGFIWCGMIGSIHWLVYGAILVCSIIGIYFLSDLIKTKREGCIKKIGQSIFFHFTSAIIIIVSFILFSSYWILPGFLMGGTSRYKNILTTQNLESWYSRTSMIELMRMNSTNTPTSTVYSSDGFIFGSIELLNLLFILGLAIFLFGILAIIFKPKNRYTTLFSIILIGSLFLVTMIDITPQLFFWFIFEAPFHNWYGWAFRTPKFSQFIAISLFTLMGFSMVGLQIRLQKWKFSMKYKKILGSSIIILLITSILITNWPVLTGDLNRQVLPEQISDEFTLTNSWLEKMEGDFKVLWLPSSRSREVSDNQKYSYKKDIHVLSSSKPTYDFDYNTQINGYGIYVLSSIFSESSSKSLICNNITSNLGKIISPLGIRYIIFHNDNSDLYKKNDLILNNLKNQKDLELVMRFNFIYIFENTAFDQDFNYRFYTSTQNNMVFGGLRSLGTFGDLPEFQPRQGGLIFGNQKHYEKKGLEDSIGSLIFTEFGGIEEILFTFMDEKHFISPFEQIKTNRIPETTWSKNRMTNLIQDKSQSAGDIVAWDWPYGEECVYTWSPGNLKKNIPEEDEELIVYYNFEVGMEDFYPHTSNTHLTQSNYSTIGQFALNGIIENGTNDEVEIVKSQVIGLPGGRGYCSISMDFAYNEMIDFKVFIKLYDENSSLFEKRLLIKEHGSSEYKKLHKNVFLPEKAKYYLFQIEGKANQDTIGQWWIDEVNVQFLKDSVESNRFKLDFNVNEDDQYNIYTRNLMGKKGGTINIRIDGDDHHSLNTVSTHSAFKWNNIGSRYLREGRHSIEVDNIEGFNAINLIAVVPQDELQWHQTSVEEFIGSKDIVHFLEAESVFNFENSTVSNSFGFNASMGEVLNLSLDGRAWIPLEIVRAGNYSMKIRSQLASELDMLRLNIGNTTYDLGRAKIDIDPESNLDFTPFYNITKSNLQVNEIINLSFEDGWNSSSNAPNYWCPPESKIITTIIQNIYYIMNLTFEDGWNESTNSPDLLYAPKNSFSASLDSLLKTEGDYSLKITTNNTDPDTWSSMNSHDFEVDRDTFYTAKMDVRFENTNRTHVKLQGYNNTIGKWNDILQLVKGKKGTGNQDWKTYEESFFISENISKIRLKLNAGTVLNQTSGNSTVWFDNFSLFREILYNDTKIIEFSASLDNIIKTEGRYALKITTNSSEDSHQSRMNSRGFIVESNKSYEAKIDMKWENTNRSHMKICGYDNLSGRWVDLVQLVTGKEGIGDVDWDEYHGEFFVPKGISKIRLTLNVGHKYNPSMGNSTVWFDNFTLNERFMEIDTIAVFFKNPSINLNDEKTDAFHWLNLTDILLKKGTSNLELSFHRERNHVLNLSFEHGWDQINNTPHVWKPPRSKFHSYLDPHEKIHGRYSLKMITNATGSKMWSWMESEEIPLRRDAYYKVTCHVRTENVNNSHIKISGYNVDSDEWKDITNIVTGLQGNAGWTEFSKSFFVPSYVSSIKVVLNMGTVQNSSLGNATMWFDNFEFLTDVEKQNNTLDLVILYSNEDTSSLTDILKWPNVATITDFRKIDATRYEVKVSASAPFTLCMAEMYDEFWIARVDDGAEINSIPMYGMMNGFFINRTGNFTVTIEYKPQKWLEIGMGITCVSIFGSLGFLIWIDRTIWKMRINKVLRRRYGD